MTNTDSNIFTPVRVENEELLTPQILGELPEGAVFFVLDKQKIYYYDKNPTTNEKHLLQMGPSINIEDTCLTISTGEG